MNGDLISRSALLEKAVSVTEYDEGGWGFDFKAVPVDYVLKAPAVIDRFKEAFGSIASYNGHEEWLWELSDELAATDPTDLFVRFPITDAEWLTEKHALWMMLVSAFGDWGTSIRSGWIEKTKEAAKFINDATDRYADWRADDAD